MIFCRICGAQTDFIFKNKVMNKYDGDYYKCSQCGFIQVNDPFWLKDAYANPINDEDRGLLQRNINLSLIMAVIIVCCFDKKGTFLDFGGGYGIFARLMNDFGFNFKTYDKYTGNLFGKDLEADLKSCEKYNAVSSFELLEHLEDPLEEIKFILTKTDTLVFSTTLHTGNYPDPNKWEYYGFSHGQHISFFSRNTLEFIACELGKRLYSDGDKVHMLTDKKICSFVFRLIVRFSVVIPRQLLKLILRARN